MRSPLEMRELCERLELEPGVALVLESAEDPDAPDPDPWFFLVVELDFESGRAVLVQLSACAVETARSRVGRTIEELLENVLIDLDDPQPGIRWRKA